MSQQQSSSGDSLTYPFSSDRLDEVYGTQGEMKPEWSYMMESLNTIGRQSLSDRQEKARRILRDDGATYNLYEDTNIPNRTWGLDLVPSIISSTEWASIEAGLLERAELFNLILKDIYGDRQLIKQAVIPPEAIYAHGGFLRACNGLQIEGEHQLLLHAVDMVRTEDGSMCVIADRTQAPSGAGYALENRTVMSRVLPSLFRDSHVHRLASFFQKLRNKLNSLSNSEGIPRVVVLTPGYFNETYFEHAYLANYLGFPLVQGGDLVARNGFVWMKSLDGLAKVDVILRYVDDTLCDPVELRADSQLGVPGLLDVARGGRVVIANPLGSGILENPVIMKYLPQISKFLLGREPRLATAKTYWCADKKDFQFIESNLDNLIIKPIYRSSGPKGVWGSELSVTEKQDLLVQIKSKPYQYVAQEMIEKAHIPSFTKNGLEARPSILRSFSVASDRSYSVMPGGLTRIGSASQARFISMQQGSKSKDTWVTASEPERIDATSAAGVDMPIVQQDSVRLSLPSRVVENLFWMGRYAERAEASLRVLRTAFVMINGDDELTLECKRLLLCAVTQISSTQPGFINAKTELIENPEQEFFSVIADENRMGSIRSTLNSMIHAADQSKELLSSDTMRVINDIRDALLGLNESLRNNLSSAPEEVLDPFVTALMALSGLTQESMVRGPGWHFMEMGKRIERSSQTIVTIKSLLSKVLSDGEQQTMLNSLLLTFEVLITYRRRYRARADLQLGLELVMLDKQNPRSLLYQFEVLQKHIEELPQIEKQTIAIGPAERATLEAITTTKLCQLENVLKTHAGKRENLVKLLDQLDELICSVSNVISDKYFDHRISAKQLVSTFWGDND